MRKFFMDIKVCGMSEQYLRVILGVGEQVIGEPDVMVAATKKIDVIGTFAEDNENTENIFIGREANSELILAPSIPGNVYVVKCEQDTTYTILKHSLFARTKNIDVKKKYNTYGHFEYILASGQGFLCFSAFGEAYEIKLDGQQSFVFDDSHILGWENSLEVESVKVDIDQKTSITDDKSLEVNFEHGNLSGEDLVLKFSGKGKVYFCTRNKDVYLKELVNSKGK